MLLIGSPRFAEHLPPPGHPERPERAEVFDAIADGWRQMGHAVAEPRPATHAELERVHTPAYVAAIAATAGQPTMLDADTFTSAASYEIALLAAGAAVDAGRHTMRAGDPAFALVRPPGHHAEPDQAMGFCLFNNIAVAAAALRAEGASRVAIVDIDVHHGNGTQTMFYADPTVLYASTHQYPYYPGTGSPEETGIGAAAGTTVNVPLDAGTRDPEFEQAYASIIVPAVQAFRPDVILVSAGYDAHERDPLGGLRVTTEGYARVVAQLRDAAARCCGGRLALVTEGGYDLAALRDCLSATIRMLT